MAPNSKRRRINPVVVEEISFDPAARREYLTGFHKRKLQRTKHAQEAAARRAREERIEARKRLREERKADLERHVEEVNETLKQSVESSDTEREDGSMDLEDWGGISDDSSRVDHEAEFVDEDKHTHVTVEAMDLSKEALFGKTDEDDDPERVPAAAEPARKTPKAPSSSRTRRAAKPAQSEEKAKRRKKKRNFRYETRTERKETRTKEKLKNRKQARQRKAG